MNAETLEFNLQSELRKVFSGNKDEETIEAGLALQSIEHSLAQKFGERLSNNTALVAYFGSLVNLALKAFKEGNEKSCNKYLLILSRTVGLVFSHSETEPELASKCLALINSMTDLAKLLVDYAKQLKVITRPLIFLLRMVVYAKKTDPQTTVQEGGYFLDCIKVIFEGLIHDSQPVRKEAGKAVHFMLENGFSKSAALVKSFDSFCKFNMENWFIQPQRAQYTMYALSTCLVHFEEERVKEYVNIFIRIIEGKSSVELKSLSCLVIENLFSAKHINNVYTKELVIRLIDLCEKTFPDATHPHQLTSLVQCLVQVYLNYNTGTPFYAKEMLPKVLDICAELLSLNPEEVTTFDAATVLNIKERVTKNIELLLILSCDEYLFPSDEGLDLFGAMSIQANLIDNIREKEGLSKMGNLTPRKKLLITLKNLLSSRFDTSRVYVLNIIDSFCTKLNQLGLTKEQQVSDDMIELLVEIRENCGFSSLTEKCLGNMIAKVDMETLLERLPIKVLEVDLSSPTFDEDSNAYVLSLLAVYKSHVNFRVYYKYMWNQLLKSQTMVKNQAHFKDSQHNDKLLFVRLSHIENQYLTVLKKSIIFQDSDADQFVTYLSDLLTVLLGLGENETEKLSFYGEPLKFLLVACISHKQSNPQLYAQALAVIREQNLMAKMCKLNNKLEKKVAFVTDCIKLLVIMLEKTVAVSILAKNVARLQQYFSSCQDFKHPSFERNLKDMDTIVVMTSVLKELHSFDVYHSLNKLLAALFAVENERVWKKATNLAQAMVQNCHYSYCPAIFEKVSVFFESRMQAIKANKSKQNQAIGMSEEKLKSKKFKQRLQGIILKVAKEFVTHYFIDKIKDLATEGGSGLEKVGEELTAFCDSYLPIAVVCTKNKSGKTRDHAKDFLFRLDDAYTQITGDNKSLMSSVLAGLAGKTSLMKSATIQVIGIMLEKKDESLEADYKEKIAEVILIVLKDQNKEIFHAVVGFLRVYIKLTDERALKQQLPLIMQAIYEFDSHSAKNSTKSMTQLLERLVKKLGETEVGKSLPDTEKNVLRYIRRQEKRASKVKSKKRAAEFESKLKCYALDRLRTKNGLENLDVDKLDARNDADLKKIKQSQSGMNEEPVKAAPQAEDLLLRFDANKETFHFTKHHIFQIKAANRAEADQNQKGTQGASKGEVYFDEATNKLVVKEKEKQTAGFKRKARDVLDDIGSENEEDQKAKTGPGAKKPNKANGAKMEDETLAARMLRKANMLKKKENLHIIRESGELYRAKGSTRGDVMIPGKIAPHAFVQLNPMALQKKNRDKASEIFGYLVNRKKTGLLKGLVSKTKK